MSARPVEFSLRSYVTEASEQRPQLVSAAAEADAKSGLRFDFASLNKQPPPTPVDALSSLKVQQLRVASDNARDNAKADSMRLSAANDELAQRVRKQTERAVAAEAQVQKLYMAVMADRQTASSQAKVAGAEAARAKAVEQQLRDELSTVSRARADAEGKLASAALRLQDTEAASGKVAVENTQLKAAFSMHSAQIQKLTDDAIGTRQKCEETAIALEQASALAAERESERDAALKSLEGATLKSDAAAAERKEAMAQLSSVFQNDENRTTRMAELQARARALEAQCVKAATQVEAAEARTRDVEEKLSKATKTTSEAETRHLQLQSDFDARLSEARVDNAAAELKQQLASAAAREEAALEAKQAIAAELEKATNARDALAAQVQLAARPETPHPNADPIRMAARYDALRSQVIQLTEASDTCTGEDRPAIVNERNRLYKKAAALKARYDAIFTPTESSCGDASTVRGIVSGVAPEYKQRSNGMALKLSGVNPLGRGIHSGTVDAAVSVHVPAISAMEAEAESPASAMVTAVVSDLSNYFKYAVEAKRGLIEI